MEIMINRWIRETLSEYDRAKSNQNLFRMAEMGRLLTALHEMRDTLTISKT